MVRTQIYLPTQTHQRLMRLAKHREDSMANMVRKFIEEGLSQVTEDNSGMGALKALAGLKLTGGPADLSANIDRYLYGGKEEV